MTTDDIAVAFAAIHDDHDRVAQTLARLPTAERGCLGPAATRKRTADFVAGRQAARAALVALLGEEEAGRCVVLRTAEGSHLGAPVVVSQPPSRRCFVSITHAAGLAGAVAAFAPVAIDVVAVEAMSEAMRREAFVEGELAGHAAFLGSGDAALACAFAFAVKEAALKIERVGFGASLLALHTVASAASNPTVMAGWPDARPFTLAWTLDDQAHGAQGWWAMKDGCVVVLLADRARLR